MLKRSTLFAFAAPSLPVGAIGLPLIVYLPPYYAGTLGMDLAVVGLIFFLVRLLDLPLDPLLGHLMDGTRSRFGRYRPWLVAGGFVMALGTWLVFMAAPGISAGLAFAQLMLLYFGFSLMVVALLGWGATLSDDYHQRARVFGWFQATTILSMVLILAIAPLAVRMAGGEDASAGIHAMGWFIILLAPLTAFYAAARLPERPHAAERQKATFADFRALARNPLILRLLLLDVLASVAPGITGAMFLFYFEHRLGFAAGEASLLLLVYFLAGLAAAPLWIGLSRRIGKHKAMAAACLFYCVAHGSLGLLGSAGFWVALPAMMIAGVPYAAAPFLLRAMLADVADADRLETGLDRNGLLQAVLTTTQKVAYATPVALIYPLLALIGFDPRPGAGNSDGAILGMTVLFVLPPVLLMAAAAWVVARWRLGPGELAEVQAALAARAAAAE
ncbi:MAG: MFS transporter [Allosphingosinicella sp.]|uniref:MFS transporter n=1 Tax=Allosphingosinicella sp. TaxID=2823234 RepID=UPI003952BD3F